MIDAERWASATPEFTDRDMELIVASLADEIDQRRLDLLPDILRDWSTTGLATYRSRETQPIIQQRRKRQKAVGKLAEALLQALDALDERDREEMTYQMGVERGLTLMAAAQNAEMKKRLDEGRGFLAELAAAGLAPKAIWKPGRGQPPNALSSLVMRDLVAIFEWVTGTRATRAVDRSTGAETGPFWRFAAAVWPVVFRNGIYGLSAAIKRWATSRACPVSGDLQHRVGPPDMGDIRAIKK